MNAVFPVYRVLNREENLNFYRDVLGMKVLNEENATVDLGGFDAKSRRIILEESPESRSVNGAKKHGKTVLIAAADEISQLLVRNLDKVNRVFKTENGFAFEAISPENDVFLLTESLSNLTEIAKSELEIEEKEFAGLSDFTVAELTIRISDEKITKYYNNLFGSLDLLKFELAEGSDLTANTVETLDLEALMIEVSADFDLAEFSSNLTDFEKPYLDKSEKLLALEIPNHLDFWLVK